MNRQLFLPVVVIAVALSACVTQVTTGTIVQYPVTGVVTAGPTCPVENRALPPACEDRPVPGAFLLILDADGDEFGEVRADANGAFTLNLPAGTYTVEPQPVDGLMGTAAPQDFEAGPGLTVDLLIQYDTGIR